MGKSNREWRIEQARAIFLKRSKLLRTKDILTAGIHPRTLYDMRDTGILEQVSRGVYRLADQPAMGNPDLMTVAVRVPEGVICLISALSFHEMTSQVPHEVYLSLSRGKWGPKLDYPPIRVFWFTGPAFRDGVEVHMIDDVPVRIYNPEKTLADCFKYRNKIGIDTVTEALRLYRQTKPLKVDTILRYARVCRVEKVMRPYLESIL